MYAHLRMAVWSQAWYIVVPLVLVILGHWSFLLHGMFPDCALRPRCPQSLPGILLKADYVPGTGCVITYTDNTILAATFIYSMAFDFTVLTLTGWKLAFPTRRENQSRIVQLIFGDGLIFFMIA